MKDLFQSLFTEALQLINNDTGKKCYLSALARLYKCIHITVDNNSKAMAYFEIGGLFLKIGLNEEALISFKNAAQLFSCSENIAHAYVEIGCISKNTMFLEMALNLFPQKRQKEDTQKIINSMINSIVADAIERESC